MAAADRTVIMHRLALVLLLAGSTLAAEQPFLHPIFADHAVLQRDRELPVWGWSKPGDTVTVALAGKTATATAGTDGRWLAVLPALPAGGPFVLTASGAQSARAEDVLIGEVWICSGQSNMEWIVQNSDGWPQERETAKGLDSIRQFRVGKVPAISPQRTCTGRWRTAPEGVAQFTAVGWYFARELQRSLQVPIGVVNASWGGTTIEAWTSVPGLAGVARAKDVLAKQSQWSDAKLEEARQAWWAQADPDLGQRRTDADDASWQTLKLPGTWKEQGITQDGGVAWFRRSVDLPAAAAGAAGSLSLGITVDSDTTWINGVEVGRGSGWEDPRRYAIPAGVLKSGANTIAIRLRSLYGNGGIYAAPEQFVLEAGGTKAALAGPWRFKGGLDKAALAKLPRDEAPHLAGALWNGMVEPLTPAAVRGVVWYQGETNAWTGSGYDQFLPPLIADWRARFHRPDLPFGVVQLSCYGKRVAAPVESESGMAFVRDCQLRASRELPGVGLAVTVDIGNPDDVHYRNKLDAGRRVAAWALHDVYGKAEVVPSGPVFTAMKPDGAGLRLSFDHATGLTAKGELKGFAIAAADGPWVAAEARIDGETVVVSSAQVARPAKVRYAWANSPDCPLYNGAGLPASPFRSDGPAQPAPERR